MRREEALKVEAEVNAAAPQNKETEQVAWRFGRSWKAGRIGTQEVFGSDFDYWKYVVKDAVAMWTSWVGSLTNHYDDYIAESYAGTGKGWALGEYKSYGVWQNGVKVGEDAKFTGPQVDFGPTADFSVFLEHWKLANLPNIPAFNMIGVLHTIGRKLAADWSGVHSIRVIPIAPENAGLDHISGRPEPVRIYPIIRISTRHGDRR